MAISEEDFKKKIYLGNPSIKKVGVAEEFTAEQFSEYNKCRKSVHYFAKNYVYINNLDRGLIKFDLYPYQEKMYDNFNENRFNVVLSSRQSGKSISAGVYLLWTAIFHSQKTILIAAHGLDGAMEMIYRITEALENLPFWLQPGCKKLNQKTIEFGNGSKIVSRATTKKALRGLSINILYLDEFAFVDGAEEFYTAAYPVISSSKTSKIIITSTANGLGNMFHEIWQKAIQGLSAYKPFRVDWWDVPGRDEEWKKETISNTSEKQFAQEFGNAFYGSGNTLIDGAVLLELRSEEPLFEKQDTKIYEEPIEDHKYIMTVDVAKGRGLDYTTFSIVDITNTPLRQVATYRNSIISPMLVPDIIVKWANHYNEAYVIIEANDAGAVVGNGVYYDLEYENTHMESTVRSKYVGIEMNKKIKKIGCSHFKDLIEEGGLILKDKETINECGTFEAKGASYEATEGNHDDMVMTLVMLGYFSATNQFNEMTDISFRDAILKNKMDGIYEELAPFGIIDNGSGDDDRVQVIDDTIWINSQDSRHWVGTGDEYDNSTGYITSHTNEKGEYEAWDNRYSIPGSLFI